MLAYILDTVCPYPISRYILIFLFFRHGTPEFVAQNVMCELQTEKNNHTGRQLLVYPDTNRLTVKFQDGNHLIRRNKTLPTTLEDRNVGGGCGHAKFAILLFSYARS